MSDLSTFQPPDGVPLTSKDGAGNERVNPRWSRFFSFLSRNTNDGIDESDEILSAIYAFLVPEVARLAAKIKEVDASEDVSELKNSIYARILPKLSQIDGLKKTSDDFIPNDDEHFTFDDTNNLFKILNGSGVEWARFNMGSSWVTLSSAQLVTVDSTSITADSTAYTADDYAA